MALFCLPRFARLANQPGGTPVTPVEDPGNFAPQIISNPRTSNRPGLPFAYDLEVDQADGDHLTFSLLTYPEGMTINDQGVVEWYDIANEARTYDVTVSVEDSRGASDSQSFQLEITDERGNTAPEIISVPPRFARVGELFTYDLKASDRESDFTSWRLVSGPIGSALDIDTGTLRWIPQQYQIGDNQFEVEVHDSFGVTSAQKFVVEGTCVNHFPEIGSIPIVEAFVGRTYYYPMKAEDLESQKLEFEIVHAPVGMSINQSTGLVQWVPDASLAGQTTAVDLKVTDPDGGIAVQRYAISVKAETEFNSLPVVTSSPNLFAKAGQLYQYYVEAIDPDGGPVFFELDEAPEGMAIDPNSGQITWIPAEGFDGQNIPIVVAVQDGLNGRAVQRFIIEISDNSAPVIISVPNQSAQLGETYYYALLANDLDGDVLSFSVVDGPDGLTIDRFGRVVWQVPTDVQPNSTVEVTLSVTDTHGDSSLQSYSISVEPDSESPIVQVIVVAEGKTYYNSPNVDLGSEVRIKVIASDDIGIQTIQLFVDGISKGLNPAGEVIFSASSLGRFPVFARAVDLSGNVAETGLNISVVEPGANLNPIDDNSPTPRGPFDAKDVNHPQVIIVNPNIVDGPNANEYPTITKTVDVIGTVDDPEDNLWYYKVLYAREDLIDFVNLDDKDPDWVEIAFGTEEVLDGKLAKFDTTLVPNNQYAIAVVAYDNSGNGWIETSLVNVEGNLKVGNFRFELSDLDISLAGIPISINRIYDTFDAGTEADFGFGWSLGVQDAQIFETGAIGESGAFSALDEAFVPNFSKVYLTDPNGRRIGFTYRERTKLTGRFSSIAEPYFDPDPGVYSQLEIDEKSVTRGPFFSGLTGGINPEHYTLTTKDGLEYRYHDETGLQSITDLNDNTLEFTEDGVTHSSGESIDFIRDLRGRITTIIDPSGSSLIYKYDLAGDLVEVTNQGGLKTRYEYSKLQPHFLDQAFDSLGNRTLKTVFEQIPGSNQFAFKGIFDSHGIRVDDRDFDIENNGGVVRDARGNETILIYDDRGNVLTETDPLGFVRRYEYSDSRNPDLETRVIDKDGHVTEREFDERGNLLVSSELGPESAPFAQPIITRYSYDAGNRVTSIIDARGNATTFRYDAQGNLLELTNAKNDSSFFTYDSDGNVVTFTDFNGNLTRFEGYVGGQPRLITFEDGTQQRLEYNIYGQTTYEAYLEPDGTVAWERTQRYDQLGRLIEEILGSESDGSATTRQLFYDGEVLDWEIIVHPDSLNGNGELIESPATPIADRNSSITDYAYDANLRLIQQVDAEGGVIEFRYDADGNRIALRDPVGNLTTWLYNENGRPIEERDPLYWHEFQNRDAAFSDLSDDEFLELVAPVDSTSVADPIYDDPSGASCETMNSADHVIVSCYDAVGNLDAKIDRNGRRIEYDYNFMTDLTDERWYSEAGNLVRTLSYTFDAVGNMLTANDPDSSLTFTYDEINQQLTADNSGTPDVPRVLLTYSYDANGNISSVSDDSGVTVASAYNERNLLQVRQWFDSIDTDGVDVDPLRFEFEYTAFGRQSKTDRYASLDTSNLIGHAIRGYDLAGRSTSIDFTNSSDEILSHYSFNYDALGRMNTSARAGVDAVYTHDLTGQLTSAVRSNGNDEFFSYDANGNRSLPDYVTGTGNRLKTDGSYIYEYDGEGNRISKTDQSSGNETIYRYDHHNQLVNVTETTASNELVAFTFFKYDPLNRRISSQANANSTFAVNNGDQIWAKYNADESLSDRFLYHEELDSLLAKSEAGDFLLFVNQDQVDSVVSKIDHQGQLVDQVHYSSFGQVEAESAFVDGEVGFTGRESLVGLGVSYFRSRYYDPASSTWLSEDPLGSLSGDFNFYRYAENSPLDRTDPFGLVSLIPYGATSTSEVLPGVFAGFAGVNLFTASNLLALATNLPDAINDDSVVLAIINARDQVYELFEDVVSNDAKVGIVLGANIAVLNLLRFAR